MPRAGIPPIFERFTSQARDAITAGIEHARRLNDPYVEPVHLLLGVLDAKAGLVATARSRLGWESQPARLVQRGIAVLESPDERTGEIMRSLPDHHTAAAVIEALPHEEKS